MKHQIIGLCVGLLFTGTANAVGQFQKTAFDLCSVVEATSAGLQSLAIFSKSIMDNYSNPQLMVAQVPYSYVQKTDVQGVTHTHQIFMGTFSNACSRGDSPMPVTPRDQYGGNPMDITSGQSRKSFRKKLDPKSKLGKGVAIVTRKATDILPTDTIKKLLTTNGPFDVQIEINKLWLYNVQFKNRREFQSRVWSCIHHAFQYTTPDDYFRLRVAIFAGDQYDPDARLSHDAFIHTIRHNYGNLWGIDFSKYISMDEILAADYSFDPKCELIFTVENKRYNEEVERSDSKLSKFGEGGYYLYMQKHRFEIQTAIALNLAAAIVVFEPLTGLGPWYRDSLIHAIFSNQIMKEPLVYIKETALNGFNFLPMRDLFITKSYSFVVDRVWFAPEIGYATWITEKINPSDIINDKIPLEPLVPEPEIRAANSEIHHTALAQVLDTVKFKALDATEIPKFPIDNRKRKSDVEYSLVFKFQEYAYWRKRIESRGIDGLSPEHPHPPLSWFEAHPHPRHHIISQRIDDPLQFQVPASSLGLNYVGARLKRRKHL